MLTRFSYPVVLLVAASLGCRPAHEAESLPAISEPAVDHFAPLALAPIMRAHRQLVDDPENAQRNGVLAMLYHGHEMHSAAERYYRRASLLVPDDFRWAYLLGHVQMDARGPLAAEDAFRRAERIRKSYPPLEIALADACLERGLVEEARQRYQRAADSGTNRVAVALGLAKCRLELGEPESAVDRLQALAKQWPEVRAVRYALAMAYRDAGRQEDAKTEFGAVESATMRVPRDDPLLDEVETLGIGQSAMAGFSKAGALAARGQIDEAQTIYDRILELQPDFVPALCQSGAMLIQLGELDRALRRLRHAATLDPSHAYTQNYLGWVLNAQGDYQSAERHLRQAITLDPYIIDAHITLATTFARTGRLEEAARALTTALTIDELHVAARLRLAGLLSRLGRTALSETHYRRILEIDPTLIEVHLELAAILAADGRLGESLSHVEAALQYDPTHGPAMGFKARLQQRTDDQPGEGNAQ